MASTSGTTVRTLVALTVVALLACMPPAAVAADAPPTSATVFTRSYDTADKRVTLTFDADWWSPGKPDEVLRILRENGITAGFSLTGRYVEKYPDQTRKLLSAGHKLINHSFDHPNFTQLSQTERRTQLDRAEAAFNRLGYSSAGWFRAPYRDGYQDAGVNRDLAVQGYYINYDWTFDTTGYQGASLDTILTRVRRYTVPGATIVMHLSDESTDTAALPSIISTLRSMGYGFTDPYRSVTRGLIGAKYANLGGRTSVLGAPRTGEMVATATGTTAVQWFDTGRVYWRDDVGAFEVHGAIGGRYFEFGSVTSLLGFPRTDETVTPDGTGRFNHFQGGSIYWSPASGPHIVYGAIRDKWSALDWERGLLGYPVSDEVAVTGGRASQFEGGNVYWSATTGAHEVHGAILGRYLQIGGTGSRLGLPISDEYDIDGGRRSDFRHGAIKWDAGTGVVTVLDY
ncbi:polysaccharide deacetylase family protein [Nocardia otitidiscaviarum]|uniref:polysaccharide deacetylase family protein n=1 Tax=Nocardia otitidiscaviarum TaxID=1823 RepID=UPI00130DF980|nr:polysaccharide deacetylase family protein [Nocardia otitidiscaviarum]MBF6137147.1 polysaccharide deacetylase family protein [Nocardia otitidiscaviarum]MBF6488046.1 polysaccharide deacetylase family protein [Nocardia otitidiscaviarum]